MARADREGTRTLRCAVYTRKSTDEGLDQAFNSLDAQYEACAAYIRSQRHEGWVETRTRYDDGGFSGGTIQRPGLQRLLAEVEAGRVDVIVVYKVDRLTRSLADFAKIVEVLDKRDASFVSVTQSFNTTSSMGRLTLNMLLSFAQFEREVTGERIRDKIAASKARGIWMGGNVPFGYCVEDRRLLVDEADAATVRHLFERYLALGSGRALVGELLAQGARTKVRQTNGGLRGGVPWQRGTLFALLQNRVYLGETVHKGVAHPGEHKAIVDAELFEAVQAHIASQRVAKRERRSPTRVLLTGRIVDGHGRPLSPSHAVKGRVRYYYYITHSGALTPGGPAAWRLPAKDVDQAVLERLTTLLRDRRQMLDIVQNADASVVADVMQRAADAADGLSHYTKRQALIGQLVERIQVRTNAVEVWVDRQRLRTVLGLEPSDDTNPIRITAPATKVRTGKATKLVVPPADGASPDPILVALLREAHQARDAVLGDPAKTIAQHAITLGLCRKRLARLLRVSWLSPEITCAILAGRQPAQLTARKLLTLEPPLCWDAQRDAFGQSRAS